MCERDRCRRVRGCDISVLVGFDILMIGYTIRYITVCQEVDVIECVKDVFLTVFDFREISGEVVCEIHQCIAQNASRHPRRW